MGKNVISKLKKNSFYPIKIKMIHFVNVETDPRLG
jgi:hypothetical protein